MLSHKAESLDKLDSWHSGMCDMDIRKAIMSKVYDVE